MDCTYGIAKFDPTWKHDHETSIRELRDKYVWRFTPTIDNLNYKKYIADNNKVSKGDNLGCLIFGDIYLFTRYQILDMMANAPDEIRGSFDENVLEGELFYFVWEDWS